MQSELLVLSSTSVWQKRDLLGLQPLFASGRSVCFDNCCHHHHHRHHLYSHNMIIFKAMTNASKDADQQKVRIVVLVKIKTRTAMPKLGEIYQVVFLTTGRLR